MCNLELNTVHSSTFNVNFDLIYHIIPNATLNTSNLLKLGMLTDFKSSVIFSLPIEHDLNTNTHSHNVLQTQTQIQVV